MTNVFNAIEVRDLAKSIGKARLLEPLNLTIPCGSVVALVGHNGAGKTTLLKLLLNILQPSSGEASVLGAPATGLRGASFSDIGYVVSSHDLEEVETFATHVVFLRSGRLLFSEPLDTLLLRCREVTVTFSEDIAMKEKLRLPAGCVAVEAQGAMLRFVDLQADVVGHEEAVRSLMTTAIHVQSERMNLRAIFLALNKGGHR